MPLSKQLLALQKKHEFQVSAEYAALLMAAGATRLLAGGLRDPNEVWPTPSNGEVTYGSRDIRFHNQAELTAQIVDADDGDMGFWHLAFLRHACPVGASGGGDPIVQICRGDHKGEIYFANHECWYGGVQAIATQNEEDLEEFLLDCEDVLEELGIESLNNLDTNTWLSLVSNENLDFMFKIADSLQDLYRHLA